jgi:hypothetical protein
MYFAVLCYGKLRAPQTKTEQEDTERERERESLFIYTAEYFGLRFCVVVTREKFEMALTLYVA